ncbi:MAG TPA: hypothetical protein EYO18_03320 [Candidatus Marinimicrobia bacterium]|nr:hypothetical protein [Candidatus Neomarinimicrobiota bacterium]
MKNSARSLRALFLGLISASLLFAYHPDTFISQNVSSESREVSNPEISVMNINNMVYWIHKSGGATWSGGSLNGVQADYPAHTGGLIFADGVLWGVKDNSYGADYPIRVGGSAYSHGMKAGRVIYNTGGTVAGSDDPDNNHVWRVRRDWESADLTDDAAIFYGTDSTVSDDEIQNVRDQYEYDWNNWPADWGAPFDDVNNDGQYNPDVDIPGYPGADQTIWIISNDIPRIVDGSGNEINYWTNPIYGSDPVGIELRITLWAYNVDHDSPLGNVVFKKAGITYTGFNDGEGFIAPEVLDTVYFSQWSDPDLGEYTDDFVGCDIDLSMGFVYNGDNHDNVFTEIFGMSIPAGGYDFLQGPVDVDDIDSDGNTTEFLPMTSFSYFASGYSISDPDQWAYSGSLQWFNLMEGYLPRPEYPTQVPWIDPFTGEETKFPLSGNPVTSTGWIDGIELPPGDRRTVMSSGPFSLSLGGSADIVVGLIGGVGHTYLSSVDILKHHDAYAQWAYELNFDLPEPPPMPIVNAESFEEVFVIDWSANSGDVENMGSNHGYEFQGYNIYQLPYEDAPEEEFTLVETFDIIDLVQAIFDPVYDEETGFVIEVPVQFGSDNGIQRYFLVDWDYINDEALSIGTPYYFAVSAYNYCACPDAPVSSLESDFELIQIIPDVVPDLDYGSDVGENLYGEHSGTGNISLDIQVINPIELTGDDYMVSFAERDFGWNGYEWTEIVNQQTSGRDCSASTVTGAATWGVEYGTIDLVLTFDLVCQGSWVDGFEFNFPNDFSSYVNSWEITGGTVCSYGTGSGQNCDNLDGTWSGNVLLYGNNNVSGFGAFETGITFTLNVNPWYPGGEFTALQIDYIAYDDGYESLYEGGTTVNAQGTATIDAINEVIVSVNNWNLQNMSTGDYVLEYQTIFNDMQQEAIINGAFVGCCTELGMGANPIIDGFLISVYGSYVAPDDWHDWSFGSSYNGDDGESYLRLMLVTI